MQRLLFICLTFLSTKFALAQDVQVNGILNFSGKIGNYPIEMQLNISQKNDSISGEYYYLNNKKRESISLSGILTDDWILLDESSYNPKLKKFEVTGHFKIQPPVNQTILGRWAKKSTDFPNNDKSLSVELRLRENLKAFNPYQLVYNISKRKANYKNLTKNEADYYSLNSITISDGEVKKWVINGFDEHDLVDKSTQIEFEDVNFDGYLDLKIFINYPDMPKGGYSYLYYLYNKGQNKFIKSGALNGFGVASFDALTKTVSKYDADGSGNEGTKTYKWQNGKLYLTREERVYEDDAYIHFTEYNVINGKSVKTKEYKKNELK